MEQTRNPPDHGTPPADGPRVTARSCRSRVTNGRILHAGVDGRGASARRWRDLFREYMAETNGQREVLCRQLASLVLQREVLDSAMARGDVVDIDVLLRLSSEIRRTMTRLGLTDNDDEDEPAYDGTADAIRALHSHRETEVAS